MARHRWATAGDRAEGGPTPAPRTVSAASVRLQDLIETRQVDDDGLSDGADAVLDDLEPLDEASEVRQAPRRRWVVGRRAAVVCCGVLLAWGAFLLLGPQRSTTQTGTVPLDSPSATFSPPATGGPASGASDEPLPETSTAVVVHVTGAVHRPGVVRLPVGSRTYQAIARAGGATSSADPSAINLAAKVEDGQQIHLPEKGEAVPLTGNGTSGSGAAPGAEGDGAGGAGGRVNLNTATAAELDTLPRVGPVLAERIIQWRADHGNFTRVEDLDAVPGIGPTMMAALLDLVSV